MIRYFSNLGLKTINCFIFSCLLGTAFAQTNSQTLRGKVIDTYSHVAIVGANIVLLDTDKQTASQADGSFRMEAVGVGRYQIKVSSIGYETVILSEILMESGKETVLEIALEETTNDLQTVEVSAQASSLNRKDMPLSLHTLTIEETLRFPANFNDPVRLAVSLPGVVNANDQANGIVVRGNSPANMAWRLEGLDIVNPNHLNNAGTFSDRPTATGGGVTILSAQLLGTSNFLKGAFPANYGNALSGVFDMQLRKGNDEQREFTTEIGLLGIDLSTEGPFSKKGKASYLINYRYSTIGILDALNVPLGDESIAFQDLALHLNFPFQKGNLNVFLLGGDSKNTFEAERDTSLWLFQKDNQDIRYTNKMGAIGAKLEVSLRPNLRWNTAVAVSRLATRRSSALLQANLGVIPFYEEDRLDEQKTSAKTSFLYKKNAYHRFKFGLNTTYYDFSIYSLLNFFQTLGAGMATGFLTQPFANWQYASGTLTTNVGLQYNHFSLNGSSSLEPRASLRWAFRPNQALAVSYGLQSQLQRPQVYVSYGVDTRNQDLDFSKAHHVVLGYTNNITTATRFSIEAYYQSLFDVPIIPDSNRSFSTLNFNDGWINAPLENGGTGTNYGLEISLQRHIEKGYYYLLNTTLYRSLYVGGDGVERSTRFDGKYVFNGTIGKEWTKSKKGKDKTWGLNARITYLGGFRDSPIDIEATLQNGFTTYDETAAFSLAQAPYFKVDTRFYFRKSKANRSSTIALDLQNATNHQNVAFSYYDFTQNAIVVKNQLGLIPNLSYRMEF